MENKIGKKIVLNNAEIRICSFLAKLRGQENRNKNIPSSLRSEKSIYDMDYLGICGEFSFAKLFNLYPDMSIFVRSSQQNTDQGDVKLHSGIMVDVKTTNYMNGKLIVMTKKIIDSERLYALMVGNIPNFIFKGFISKKDLFVKEKIGNLGKGENYIANQNELKELHEYFI